MYARHKMPRQQVDARIAELIAAGILEAVDKKGGTILRLTVEASRILQGESEEPKLGQLAECDDITRVSEIVDECFLHVIHSHVTTLERLLTETRKRGVDDDEVRNLLLNMEFENHETEGTVRIFRANDGSIYLSRFWGKVGQIASVAEAFGELAQKASCGNGQDNTSQSASSDDVLFNEPERKHFESSRKHCHQWYLERFATPEQREGVFCHAEDFSPTVCAIVSIAQEICILDAVEVGPLCEECYRRGFSTRDVERALGELAGIELIGFAESRDEKIFVQLDHIDGDRESADLWRAMRAADDHMCDYIEQMKVKAASALGAGTTA